MESWTGKNFVVSFSDEFDLSEFDLEGASFPLRLIGCVTQKANGVQSELYEFAFIGRPIQRRDGMPMLGNVFMSLSTPLEGRKGPWGARVVMFDPQGALAPIGRALLSGE